jgi:hypothetical protein
MGERRITIWAGDTEPLDFENISAGGRDDLTDVTSASLFLWHDADDSKYVDGRSVTITATAGSGSFDPAGNGPTGGAAFKVGDHGLYRGFLRLTWSDGNTTRHPNGHQLTIKVLENFGEA